jgi:cysteinyl-tRNA synthetase
MTFQHSADRRDCDIVALAQQRQQARSQRQWGEADRLREQINAAGYEIDDLPEGPRIRQRL